MSPGRTSTRCPSTAGNADENDTELGAMSGADETPPVFGGCRTVSNVKANGALLVWDPATDDTTPAEEIEYRIYAFAVPVDEDTTFTEPAQVFTGVESAQVNALLEATDYRVICRAADKKGNEDDNLLIRRFTTLEDGQPPTFAGVDTVVVRSTEADVTWNAATDNQTEQTDIVYNVYVAETAGEQTFDVPTDTSLPGAAGMTIFNLPSNSDVHFVVRAVDEGGNEDENTKEVKKRTLVSFEQDVQPIFTVNCARDGCHKRPAPLQGQNLEPGFAYDNIVGVPVQGLPGNIRIDPNSQVRTDSYLYRKITNTPVIAGTQMPPPITGIVLSMEQIDTIGLWIEQGAERN
jgi:hypothetical protein